MALGFDPLQGIVKVTRIQKSESVYDRPNYELSAAFKAEGRARVETVNLFSVRVSAPIVELDFFVRGFDGELDPFDPQVQPKPLDPDTRPTRPTPGSGRPG